MPADAFLIIRLFYLLMLPVINIGQCRTDRRPVFCIFRYQEMTTVHFFQPGKDTFTLRQFRQISDQDVIMYVAVQCSEDH